MSLNALLAAERAASNRRRAARQARTRRTPSRRESLEQVAAAWCARDFLNDLDRLLTARTATLWIVWKGKRGQVYVETPEGLDVLIEAHKPRRLAIPHFGSDFGQRLLALMKAHNISFVTAWRGGEFVLQAGNADVSTTHCLALIRCHEGRKCRYMIESEPTS